MTITWVNKLNQRVYKIPSGWPNAGKSIPLDASTHIDIEYLGPFRKVDIDESVKSKRKAWLTRIYLMFIKMDNEPNWFTLANIEYAGENLTEEHYDNVNKGFKQEIKRVTGFTAIGWDGQSWMDFTTTVDMADTTDAQVLNAIRNNRYEIRYTNRDDRHLTPVKLKT